ncbi:hypothetical protein [Leptothermofonsia sp. ETS-13]|uniref:hypothetical protein n=1 Tax=Leptothermofonsia sp. ETS-13 TaxID=3035696 RepID=UPI003BA216B9
MHFLKALRVFFLAFWVVGLAACGQSAQSVSEGRTSELVQTLVQTDAIQEIQRSPKPGTIVHLKGKVGSRVPLLEGMVYELKDATGTIWVLTKGQVPDQGDEVVIRGRLQYLKYQGIQSKEQGTAYIEQQEQIQHTPALKS